MNDVLMVILVLLGFIVGVPLFLFLVAKFISMIGDGLNSFNVHTITFETGKYGGIDIQQGGFWHRFGAYMVDNMIIGVAARILVNIRVVPPLAGTVMAVLYYTAFEGSSKQATPGKMIMKLQVTDLQGKKVSYIRAFVRNLLKHLIPLIAILAGILTQGGLDGGIKYIYLLMVVFGVLDPLFIFWTEKNQAIHDMIAGCLVIRVPKTVPQKQEQLEVEIGAADVQEVVPG